MDLLAEVDDSSENLFLSQLDETVLNNCYFLYEGVFSINP
jgi:hypothetical protein